MRVITISGVIDRFILLYIYWIAFEWTILSRVPSYSIIQIIRNSIDMLPLIMFLISLFYVNIQFKKHELKILIGYFIIVLISSISLLIEIGSVIPVGAYIGVTFRFVPFLILVKFASPELPLKFYRHLSVIFWIQIILSIISIVNKDFLVSIILPPADIFGEARPTTYGDLGISTTFINTIEYSFFILALTIIYLTLAKNKVEKILVMLSSIIVMIFSFSIASLLAILIVFFLMSKHKIVLTLICVAALAIFFATNSGLLDILLGMDIKTWVQISSDYNRIGYFTKLIPEFFSGNLKDIFLGMGYDGDVINRKLDHYAGAPATLINNDNNLKYLKDVYWISIIMAQGVIVFGVTLWILYVIYSQAKKCFSDDDFFIIKAFVILIIVIGFFNQIMDVKGFTFCFWLVVAIILNRATFVDDNALERGPQ